MIELVLMHFKEQLEKKGGLRSAYGRSFLASLKEQIMGGEG